MLYLSRDRKDKYQRSVSTRKTQHGYVAVSYDQYRNQSLTMC